MTNIAEIKVFLHETTQTNIRIISKECLDLLNRRHVSHHFYWTVIQNAVDAENSTSLRKVMTHPLKTEQKNYENIKVVFDSYFRYFLKGKILGKVQKVILTELIAKQAIEECSENSELISVKSVCDKILAHLPGSILGRAFPGYSNEMLFNMLFKRGIKR